MIHMLPTGHTTLSHDANFITNNYNVTRGICLHILLSSMWESDNSELWLGFVPDYGVVMSQ
jgi:hypothetical protein